MKNSNTPSSWFNPTSISMTTLLISRPLSCIDRKNSKTQARRSALWSGSIRAVKSEKPALFMAAVATMKTSATYIAASGDSDDVDGWRNSAADQEWRDAFAGFQKVMTAYPGGRYFDEARGWLAYLMLRNHDRAGALVEYYRLLAAKHENARIEAAFSLRLVRSSATDDEMSRVEKQLANEPEAALAYAYHNIYNYSIDPGEASPPYEDGKQILNSNGKINYEAEQLRSDEREKEWKQARKATDGKNSFASSIFQSA